MFARVLSLVGSAVVLVLICVLPWCFGGVYYTTRAAATVALGFGVVVACLNWRTSGAAWRAAALPLACLIAACALGGFQLTRRAAEWSPRALEQRNDYAAAPHQSSAPSPEDSPPLTLHAPATRRDIALLIAAAAAFALGAALFSETKPLITLMITLTAVGSVVAAFGLALRASKAAWSYAGMTAPSNADPFGPFIGRNNAGGFLNICLAAAVGVLLWRIGKMSSPRYYRGYGRESIPGWLLRNLDVPLMASALSAVLILAGVAGTLSRGSLLATGIGGLAAMGAVAVGARHQIYFWTIASGAAAAIGLVVWLGQGAAVEIRWSHLIDAGVSGETRLALWREALQASDVYRWLGSGLGTFYYAHAPFQRHVTLGQYLHGENQFIEALVVAGYLGLGLFVVFGVRCLIAVRRLLRNADSGDDLAIAAAGAALLLIQVVGACFDFGWYVPALFIPLAVWTGGLVRRAALSKRIPTRRRVRRSSSASSSFSAAPAANSVNVAASDREHDTTITAPHAEAAPSAHAETRPAPARHRTAAAIAAGFGILLIAGLAWAVDESLKGALIEAADRSSRPLFAAGAEPTLEQLDAAINRQSKAVAAVPDDAEARVRLAELAAERFRVRTGGNLQQIHAQASLAERIGAEQELARLRELPAVASDLRPALENARLARRLCPYNFFAQVLTGQLCFLDEPALNDGWYFQRASRLAQGRNDWLFQVGGLELDAARPERAWADWRRAWSLRPDHSDDMWRYSRGFITPREALDALIPPDAATVIDVVRRHLNDPADAQYRYDYYDRALALLLESRRSTAQHEYARSVALAGIGRLRDAEGALSGAVRQGGLQEAWYYDLAVLRAALGDEKLAESAYQHYRISLGSSARPPEAYLNEAAELLRDARGFDPALRRRSGQLFLAAGSNAEAAKAFQAVLDHHADAASYAGLGEALLKLGKPVEAEAAAARAVQMLPTEEAYRTLLQKCRSLLPPSADGDDAK
ncbi:MAG: O-antigen ligase family protein [Planctomycetaceae bacterium]|nr:O-antigen ligase family protein [Planctomycetaceae bacterium]